MTKKLRGTNTLLVPLNPKVGGDLSPPVPMVVAPMLDYLYGTVVRGDVTTSRLLIFFSRVAYIAKVAV